MNILKSIIHIAALPIDLLADTIMLIEDATDGQALPRTRERFDKIADPDKGRAVGVSEEEANRE